MIRFLLCKEPPGGGRRNGFKRWWCRRTNWDRLRSKLQLRLELNWIGLHSKWFQLDWRNKSPSLIHLPFLLFWQMFSLQIIRISLRKPASYGLLVSIRWVGPSVVCVLLKSYIIFFFVYRKFNVCYWITFLSDSKPRCRLLWEGRDSTEQYKKSER